MRELTAYLLILLMIGAFTYTWLRLTRESRARRRAREKRRAAAAQNGLE